MRRTVYEHVICECCKGSGKVGKFVEVDDSPNPSTPKWNALSEAEKRNCEFMGFDPDNPDVPLD